MRRRSSGGAPLTEVGNEFQSEPDEAIEESSGMVEEEVIVWDWYCSVG